jgi:hypothetical protein
MSLPLNDWQFWATTIVALIALWLVARTLWPRKQRAKRTSITVGGKRV